jgi:hypothetical protein
MIITRFYHHIHFINHETKINQAAAAPPHYSSPFAWAGRSGAGWRRFCTAPIVHP